MVKMRASWKMDSTIDHFAKVLVGLSDDSFIHKVFKDASFQSVFDVPQLPDEDIKELKYTEIDSKGKRLVLKPPIFIQSCFKILASLIKTLEAQSGSLLKEKEFLQISKDDWDQYRWAKYLLEMHRNAQNQKLPAQVAAPSPSNNMPSMLASEMEYLNFIKGVKHDKNQYQG